MKLLYAFVPVFLLCSTGQVLSQEVLPAAPQIQQQDSRPLQSPLPPVAIPPVPTVKQETSLFKRTPDIDGMIEQGEWDTFYKFDYGDMKASVYVDWDSDNLYIASKSTTPTDLLVTLDANNDGWFHGMDNYEFVVRPSESEGSPTLAVSRYESQKTTANSGYPLAAAEATAFTLKTSSADKSYIYELAIPRTSIEGLDLKNGKKIGLKIAVGAGGENMIWIPAAPLGETQTVDLTTAKSSTDAPLSIGMELRDSRIAPGEELVAKITIKNKGASTVPIDTLVIGGEGKTSKILGSQLIRTEGIKPGKSYSTIFRTSVPHSTHAGSAALGLELRTGDTTVASSLLSFDIVPAYEIRLDTGNSPLERGSFSRISVIVKNNTKSEMHGRVKLSLPKDWTFRWSQDSKDLYILQEDSEQAAVFRVKPPAAPQSRTPILAELRVGDQVFSVSGLINVK
ncbi:MAG: hypothetical protein ABFD64_07885 [Armatimonadota bacterium]